MVGSDRLNVPTIDTFSHESRSSQIAHNSQRVSPSWLGCSTTYVHWDGFAGLSIVGVVHGFNL